MSSASKATSGFARTTFIERRAHNGSRGCACACVSMSAAGSSPLTCGTHRGETAPSESPLSATKRYYKAASLSADVEQRACHYTIGPWQVRTTEEHLSRPWAHPRRCTRRGCTARRDTRAIVTAMLALQRWLSRPPHARRRLRNDHFAEFGMPVME
jgi:hypothetical protein